MSDKKEMVVEETKFVRKCLDMLDTELTRQSNRKTSISLFWLKT